MAAHGDAQVRTAQSVLAEVLAGACHQRHARAAGVERTEGLACQLAPATVIKARATRTHEAWADMHGGAAASPLAWAQAQAWDIRDKDK